MVRKSSRSKRIMRRLAASVVAVVALSSVAGASASAATWQPPGTAFNGAGTLLETVGTHHYVSSFTLNEGEGIAIKCEEASLTGTTRNPVSAEVKVSPKYGRCTSNIAGTLVPATVTTPGEWALTSQALSGASYTASLSTVQATIKVPALGACTLSIPQQAVKVSGTNDLGSPPVGTTINPTSAAAIDFAYAASGCPGVTNGKLKYRGAVHVPTVYVGP